MLKKYFQKYVHCLFAQMTTEENQPLLLLSCF